MAAIGKSRAKKKIAGFICSFTKPSTECYRWSKAEVKVARLRKAGYFRELLANNPETSMFIQRRNVKLRSAASSLCGRSNRHKAS
jgi:hypothetical protein